MSDAAIHTAWITADDRVGGSAAPQADFPWWSFSKTVLTICALRLVAEGRLTLDAPVPDQPYSLRQLLQHTSGVPNYGGLSAYHAAVDAGEDAWPRAELLRRVQGDRLDFAPGTGWAYSNVGMLQVRMLLEGVAGTRYGDLLAQVFPDAGFRLAETRTDFTGLHEDVACDYDPNWVYHGCMIGPALSAAQLLARLLRGKLLPEAMLDEMLTTVPVDPGTPARPWRNIRAGLGVFVCETDDLGRAIGHPGGGPGSTCGVWYFPDLPKTPSVAAFSAAQTEDIVEWAVIRCVEDRA